MALLLFIRDACCDRGSTFGYSVLWMTCFVDDGAPKPKNRRNAKIIVLQNICFFTPMPWIVFIALHFQFIQRQFFGCEV